MNLLKSTLSAVLLLSSTYVSAITFYSDISDPSSSSSITSTSTVDTWIDPTGTVLDGASWIQPSDAWYVDGSGYSFYELDLSTTADYILTSLFMSFDDHTIVSIGSEVIFDSTIPTVEEKAWTKIHDVFDSSLTSLISSTNKLTFQVANTLNGPTGVIWKGTAELASDEPVAVPEPSLLFVLGLGLVAFSYKRKKNNQI